MTNSPVKRSLYCRSFPILTLLLSLSLLLLGSCNAEVPSWDDADVRKLNQWLDVNAGHPSRLIAAELLNGESVAFIHDNPLRGDSIRMMEALLPSIYDAGVRDIAVFFLESGAQTDIDTFLEAEEEGLPRDLIRLADARLGYSEYCDFLKYVRDFNRRIEDSAERIRIIGLGDSGDIDNEAIQAFLDGEDETGNQQAPRLMWITETTLDRLPTDDSRPVTVEHYGPDAGLIDEVLKERDIRDRSVTYAADDELISGLPGIPAADSEIVIVTPFAYAAVTPIEDFIVLEYLESARVFFPDSGNDNMPNLQVRSFNRSIERSARRYARELRRISGSEQ